MFKPNHPYHRFLNRKNIATEKVIRKYLFGQSISSLTDSQSGQPSPPMLGGGQEQYPRLQYN